MSEPVCSFVKRSARIHFSCRIAISCISSVKIRPSCNVQGRHVSSTVMTSTVMSTAAKATKWLCAGEFLEQLRYGALRPDVVTMGAIMESWTFQHAWQRSIWMLCLDNGWTVSIFLSDKQGNRII